MSSVGVFFSARYHPGKELTYPTLGSLENRLKIVFFSRDVLVCRRVP